VDGALVDLYHLPHGHWEAKDEKDDLAKEVQRKLDKGYPRDNIIFQAPERAILYQGGARVWDKNITHPEALVSVVNQFFDYKAPHIQEWDPYVKAFRWATDRIGDEGIVAFVSNSSFVHERSMDGMRARVAREFDAIYTLDLGGNVYKNPKLSGTIHNVFGIKVGVSITLLVRRSKRDNATIRYGATEPDWRKEQKYSFLEDKGSVTGVKWAVIQPDSNQTWVTTGLATEFKEFVPLADTDALFSCYLLGLSTNRDETAIAFSGPELAERVRAFCRGYSTEVLRQQQEPDGKLDDHVKWSETLKLKLKRGIRAKFDSSKIRNILYRPFATEFVYYDNLVVDRPSHFEGVFPQGLNENIAVCLTGPGSDKPFLVMAARLLVDLHLVGAGCTTQCFPFYTYAEDGTHRRENITDWALEQFRAHYHDPSITKWDIFHYIYAVLHHPEYRERYAANLRRELPPHSVCIELSS